MMGPSKIFVDTSAWIEILLKDEKYHKSVSNYFVDQLKSGAKFLTCDYVLDETWTRLLTNRNLKEAKALRNKVKEAEDRGVLLVLWTDQVLFDKAWKNFVKFAEHRLSFTDALIVTIVKDLKLDEVLSLDGGFRKVGLTVKPAL